MLHHCLGDGCANHRSLRRCDLPHIHSLAPPVSGVQGWEYLGCKTIHFACLVAGSAPPAVTLQGCEAPERRGKPVLGPCSAVDDCPPGRCLSCLSSVLCSFPSITAPLLSWGPNESHSSPTSQPLEICLFSLSLEHLAASLAVTRLRNAPSRPALPCSRCCLSNSTAYLSNCFGLNTANVWSLLKPAPQRLFVSAAVVATSLL